MSKFYLMKTDSSLLSVSRRKPHLELSVRNWGKNAQRSPRRSKSILMIRKAGVLVIPITLVNTVLFVNPKNFVERIVRIHLPINAVYVPSALFIVRIL